MSPPAQSWPFLDPMLPHLYWPWEATHNKPPTCNPSSQSLLPRECDLRHLSATRCQHNSQGKARSSLIYVDPSMILCLVRMESQEPCHLHAASSFKKLCLLYHTSYTGCSWNSIHMLLPQDFSTYCSVFFAGSSINLHPSPPSHLWDLSVTPSVRTPYWTTQDSTEPQSPHPFLT